MESYLMHQMLRCIGMNEEYKRSINSYICPKCGKVHSDLQSYCDGGIINGWVCPSCKRVVSPLKSYCSFCNPLYKK